MYGLAEYGAALYAGPRVAAPPTDTAPHTAIEWSPETGALETPAWVDITGDCRYWETSRGRTRELERHQPGRATIVLSNLDRQYDSSNVDGPNVGNLVPRRRVRIRQTFGGVTYPVFDGYINRWALDYPGTGKDATATIIATDAAGILAGGAMESVYVQEVRADAPVAWWRLGNPAVDTEAADWAGGTALTYVDNPRGGEALVTGDPQTSTAFDHPAEGSGNVAEAAAAMAVTYPFTFEAVFRSAQQADGTSRMLLEIGGNSAQRFVDVFIADTGSGGAGELTVLLTANQYASGAQYGTSGVRVDDKRIHHVVLSFYGSDDVECWVDGVFTALGGSSATVALPTGTVQVALGNIASNYPFGGEFGLDGELQDVALYSGVLSDARIAAHAAAAAHPWQADLPGARIGRVLDATGWPTDLRDLDDGLTTLQSAAIDGTSALEHLQKVGETEFGLLFIDRAGNVRLIDRTAVFARDPDPAVIGDTTGEVGYRAVAFDDGDGTIRNRATISRLNGAAQVAEDATSVTAYGRYDYTLDGLLHQSDSYSADYADFIVGEYKDPRRRIVGLTLGAPIVGEETAVYGMVLARELGDAVTVRNRPPGGGDPFEQVSVIEGIRLRGRPSRDGGIIEADWTLSPELGTSF